MRIGWTNGAMRAIAAFGAAAAVLAMALMLAGCGHRLVPAKGQSTVKVFPDEATFLKIQSLKAEGQPASMFGAMGASLLAHDVGANTPIRIVTSDAHGVQIEVTDGPNKGLKGFVAKNNVQ